MKRKQRFAFHLPLLLLVACALCTGGEDADFRKAQGYYTLQEYKLAVDAFKAYAAAHPKSERADQAALLLAESQFQLKQYPDAAASYDAFLAAHPASARRPDALLRALRIHFLLKNYPASLAAAETFLKENRVKVGKPDAHPELPKQIATALYYAGESQFGLKNTAAAQAAWEDLIKSYPDSKLIADASEGLGWIYFDKNQYDAALERFRVTAAVQQHPRAGWAMLMQGRSLAALKKYTEALAAFKAAPTLQPDVKEIQQEAALRTAETLLAAQDYANAVAAYQQLAKSLPTVPSTPLAVAAATYQLYDAKQHKEALQTAEAYLSLNAGGAERPAILRVKARALLASGNAAGAAEAAKQAVNEAAALAEGPKKAEEHAPALMLLAELSGKDGVASYETAAKLYPSTRYGLNARYELARLAAQENQTDAALSHVKALLEALKQPNVDASPGLKQDALFAAAEFTFRKNDYKQAEEYLNQYSSGAAENDPRGDDIARKKAWCRHEQKDDAEAAKILDAALAKFPKSALRDEMLYLRAIAASKLNDAASAQRFGDELLANFPDSPFADDALYERATAQFKKGALPEAIADLTALLGPKYQSSPLRPSALQLRATAYLQAGKAAEATADADAALRGTVEKSPALELLRALALSAQNGKEAEASAALSALIQAAPKSVEGKQALLRRAYLHFAAKNFAKAKEDFKAYLDAETQAGADRVEAEILLAVCLRELKEPAEARALLERLATNNPQLNRTGFEINTQLGNIQFETKDYTRARESYAIAQQCALKAAGEIPPAAQAATALNLAWSLRYLKENSAAEKAFGDVLKLDADGAFAAEALLERGRILDETGKSDEALAAWTQLLEKKPESEQAPRALLLKAQRLAKLARFKDAAPEFEKFVTKYAADKAAREAWSGLAESRLQQGNAAGAAEAFMKVLGEKGLDAELDEAAERAILGLAELNLRKGDALNAKKLALRILTERPGSAWTDAALFSAGQASETLGEPERAVGYYRKLLADHPQSEQGNAAKERLKALGAAAK